MVAEEVRNLAGRSAKAVRETSGRIQEMADRIDQASSSIQSLTETLGKIRENSIALSENSDEVAKLASEQSVGVKQVRSSLEQINQSITTVIAVSRETATIAESILQQAATLRQVTHENRGREQILVGSLGGGELDTAITELGLGDEPKRLTDSGLPKK